MLEKIKAILNDNEKIDKVITFMIKRNKDAGTKWEIESKDQVDALYIPALKTFSNGDMSLLNKLKSIELADILWYIGWTFNMKEFL